MPPSPSVAARPLAALLVVVAAWARGPGAPRACAAEATPPGAVERPEPPEPPDAEAVLLPLRPWDRLCARLDAWREGLPLRLAVGAEHWVNVRREDGRATYGYPDGGEGTYAWWVTAHLEAPFAPGSARRFGAHLDVEWREKTKFAPWYDRRLWLQEGYLFADVLGGRLSAGALPVEFGLADDGTWWGTLPYYDGLTQDTEWGLSFRRALLERGAFTLSLTAQALLAENAVGGAAAGGDAESDDRRAEGPTGVLRLGAAWDRGGARLELGLAGLWGTIDGRQGLDDEPLRGAAFDATWTRGALTLRAGLWHVDGVRHGEHYVTGGPTRQVTDLTLAAALRLGPFTPHVAWSAGWLRDPGGEQACLIVGVDVALLRKVSLYLEYVEWTATADGAEERTLEDGFQLVLGWEL